MMRKVKLLSNIKDIVGYEGLYQITSDGKVYSLYSHRYIKTHITKCGYERIKLYKNHKSCQYDVHRLVAEAFIPNNDNKEQVNHIDGNKLNNNVSNLEWVTRLENIHHAYNAGLKIPARKIICIETGEIFNSAKEIEQRYDIWFTSIYRVCKGERKTAGGYHWRYYEEAV